MDACMGCIPNLKLETLLKSERRNISSKDIECRDILNNINNSNINCYNNESHKNDNNININNNINNCSNIDNDTNNKQNQVKDVFKSSIFKKFFKQKHFSSAESFEPFLENISGGGGYFSHQEFIPIPQGKTLIGKSKSLKGTAYYIEGCDVEDHHCYLLRENHLVSIFPIATCTFVDGHRVIKSITLEHNSLLSFGLSNNFRFHQLHQHNLNNTPGYLTRFEIQELRTRKQKQQVQLQQTNQQQVQLQQTNQEQSQGSNSVHQLHQQKTNFHSTTAPVDDKIHTQKSNFSNTLQNYAVLSNTLPHNLPSSLSGTTLIGNNYLLKQHPHTVCSGRKLIDDVLYITNQLKQTPYDSDNIEVTSNSFDSFSTSSSTTSQHSQEFYDLNIRNNNFKNSESGIKHNSRDKFQDLKVLLLAQATKRLHKGSNNNCDLNNSGSYNKNNNSNDNIDTNIAINAHSQDGHSCSSLRTYNPTYSAVSSDISNSSSLQKSPFTFQDKSKEELINRPSEILDTNVKFKEPRNVKCFDFANKTLSLFFIDKSSLVVPSLKTHSKCNFNICTTTEHTDKLKSLSDSDLHVILHLDFHYNIHKSGADLKLCDVHKENNHNNFKIVKNVSKNIINVNSCNLSSNNIFNNINNENNCKNNKIVKSLEILKIESKVQNSKEDTQAEVDIQKHIQKQIENKTTSKTLTESIDSIGSNSYADIRCNIISPTHDLNISKKSNNSNVTTKLSPNKSTSINIIDKGIDTSDKTDIAIESIRNPASLTTTTIFKSIRMDDDTNVEEQDPDAMFNSQLDLEHLYEVQKSERLEEEKRAADEQRRLDDLLRLCNKMGLNDNKNIKDLLTNTPTTSIITTTTTASYHSTMQPTAQQQPQYMLPLSLNIELASKAQNKDSKPLPQTIKSFSLLTKPNDDINFSKQISNHSKSNGAGKENEESSSFLIDGILKQGFEALRSDSEDGGRMSPVADSGVEFCSPDWSQLSQRSFQQQQLQHHQQLQQQTNHSLNKNFQHFSTPSTFDFRCASEDRRLPPHPPLSFSLSSSNFIGAAKNSQRSHYHSYHRSPVNHNLNEPKLHRFGSDSRITNRERWDDSSQELQLLRDLQRDVMQNITDIKNKISDSETQQNEALRELEVERALLDGERDILLDQLNASKSKITHLEESAQEISASCQQNKIKDQNQIKHEKSKLKDLENKRKQLEEHLKIKNIPHHTTNDDNTNTIVGANKDDDDDDDDTDHNVSNDAEVKSNDEMMKRLEDAKEAEESQRFLVENLEFQMLEVESKDEEEREKMEREIRMEREELINMCLQYQTTLDQIASQQSDLLRQVNEDVDELQGRKELLQQQLMKEDSILRNINQQIDLLLRFTSSQRINRERLNSLSRMTHYTHHQRNLPGDDVAPHHTMASSSLSSRLDGGWWRASSQTLPRLDHPQHHFRSKLNNQSNRIAMNLFEEEKRFHHYPSKAQSSMITPIRTAARDWSKTSPGRGLTQKTASWLAGASDTEDSTSESENQSDKAISSLSSKEDQLEKIKDMECQLLLARAEKIKLIESQKQEREKELEVLEEERRRRKEAEMMMIIMKKKKDIDAAAAADATAAGGGGSVGGGGGPSKHTLTNADKQQNRPLTRYLPTKDRSLDLLTFITSCGHNVDQCRHVVMTSSSCRGVLTKMAEGLGGRVRSWKKRWFVFDRMRKCLSYYVDSKESKPPRNVVYFQSIEDVFVDHLHQVNSPTPQLTFCLKTLDRMYYLVAPSADAMRIWIDVLFTGAEGHHHFV